MPSDGRHSVLGNERLKKLFVIQKLVDYGELGVKAPIFDLLGILRELRWLLDGLSLQQRQAHPGITARAVI